MNITTVYERARGCGFREPKVSEGFRLYLCGGVLNGRCGRLPYPVVECPACGGGIRLKRGYQKINPRLLFGDGTDLRTSIYAAVLRATAILGITRDQRAIGELARRAASEFGGERLIDCDQEDEALCAGCPMNYLNLPEVALMLNVGAGAYATRDAFLREAGERGISKRIGSVPAWFVAGETYVFVTHPKGLMPWERGYKPVEVEEKDGVSLPLFDLPATARVKEPTADDAVPAVIAVYRPHIEVTLRTDDPDEIPDTTRAYLESLERRFGDDVRFLKVVPVEDVQGQMFPDEEDGDG